MRYAIISHELGTPLPTIALQEDESGLALLLRRAGRPVAFVLEALSRATTLRPADLDRFIGSATGVSLMESSLRAELSDPVPQASQRTLTVAVCTRARAALLGECLNRLTPLRIGAGFDILVVDNAPLDQSTQRTVERFEGVRCVRESRPGLDFARNRAVAESTTDFVAFLDDDVEVDGEWFAGFNRVRNPLM